MSLSEIREQLRRECRAVGLGQVDVNVALSDGGNGLERALLERVAGLGPADLEFILDFHHVGDHLQEFANALLPTDEIGQKQQVAAWCHTLKHAGGRVLYDELKAWDLTNASALARQSHESLLGYLRHHLHRTDYPHSVANGWQIGSGMIESACKTVVCQRLKQGGMRWRESGTTAL